MTESSAAKIMVSALISDVSDSILVFVPLFLLLATPVAVLTLFVLVLKSPRPPEGWRFPANVRTWVFCVLEGLALGIPVGLILPTAWQDAIPAPDWLHHLVAILAVSAFFLLPIWAWLMMRPYRLLMLVGWLTFAALFAFLLLPRS